MRLILFLLGLGMTCVLYSGCAAPPERKAPPPDRIDIQSRIDSQQARIDKGSAAGLLTPQEAAVLMDNLSHIRREFSSLRADGRLTPREVDRLEKLLDRNSLMIENKVQNPVRRVY